MHESKPVILSFVLLALIFCAHIPAHSQILKPYILASQVAGVVDSRLPEVKASLEGAGFQVVGEYTPYDGAYVVVVSSQALQENAAKTKAGAYGVIQRISLTQVGNDVQVAYTNPLYMAQAYRMAGDLEDVAADLKKALGKRVEFGSEKGLSAKKLRDYHYMPFMPYFTDPVKLASHASHEKAVASIENNLNAGKGGTTKVYRVDISGKQSTIFGVGLKEGKGADETVMNVVDFRELKQTAHLPYELVVIGGDVYALHGKFRIAVGFPDLSMPTFMKISGAPGGIEKTLKHVSNE